MRLTLLIVICIITTDCRATDVISFIKTDVIDYLTADKQTDDFELSIGRVAGSSGYVSPRTGSVYSYGGKYYFKDHLYAFATHYDFGDNESSNNLEWVGYGTASGNSIGLGIEYRFDTFYIFANASHLAWSAKHLEKEYTVTEQGDIDWADYELVHLEVNGQMLHKNFGIGWQFSNVTLFLEFNDIVFDRLREHEGINIGIGYKF